MRCGVLAIHFGEPPTPDHDTVVAYLTNIFSQNTELEGSPSEGTARERAAELAERRAPALLAEYEVMGGSPMNEQASAQVDALQSALNHRGHDARTELAYQFLHPEIESRIEAMAAAGFDQIVLLPIYPLCGPSTTVASIDRARKAIEETKGWDPDVDAVSGWHRHPRYFRLRTNNVRSFMDDAGLDLGSPETHLVFSAHGTPEHYLAEGSRYRDYVEEFCATLAALLGDVDYDIGYQNHENRDIPWTTPDIEAVVESVDAEGIVVEPVSFMHEQSETIGELDDELADVADEAGLAFHRVPIPHDDPTFPEILADVVEPLLADVDPAMYQLRPCRCSPGSSCLNAPRT